MGVLILVLMEDALVHNKKSLINTFNNVLILVLMEDALVQVQDYSLSSVSNES